MDIPTIPIDGFHGAWLHIRRARVGVCVLCSCVQTDTGKEALHQFLTTSQKIKEAASLKVKDPLCSCLLSCVCPPEVGRLIDIYYEKYKNKYTPLDGLPEAQPRVNYLAEYVVFIV